MSFSWADFMRFAGATSDPAPAAPATVQPARRQSLASSVLSLSGPDGGIDSLAVADFISNSVNAGFAMTAKSVFGYNLEFPVHEKGCVLVTGASGRVGSHAARTLVSMGYTVFAGVANASDARKLTQKCSRDALAEGKPSSENTLIPVILDVTDPESLRAAYELVCGIVGFSASGDGAKRNPTDLIAEMAPIDESTDETEEDEAIEKVIKQGSSQSAAAKPAEGHKELFVGVINCEGTESPGALELLPLNEIMRCYEVNTAGAVAVTQCFLPLLRESKGRIVNVCSSVGITAAPINGSYAASKMALIAVSESLRVELYRFGISVSIIEPGSLDATSWSKKKETVDNTHSLQLGNVVVVAEEEVVPKQDSAPPAARPTSRSRSRAPAPKLGSLNEDEEEIPYVPPVPKANTVTNRRGSGSVDANNRPTSPQVYPYQNTSSSPTSPPLSPVSGMTREKRKSLGNLSAIPVTPVPPLPQSTPMSPTTSRDKRKSLSSLSGSNNNQVSAATMARLTGASSGNSSGIPLPVGTSPPTKPKRASTAMAAIPPMPANARNSVPVNSPAPPLVAVRPASMQAKSRRASTTDPRLRRALSPMSSLPPSSTGTVHPTWDVAETDRTQIAHDLYGPLMDTVSDVSAAARARVREGEREDRAALDSRIRRASVAVDTGVAMRRVATVGTSTPTAAANTAQTDVGDVAALTSSCRHVSRAIVHALTSPFPKTRYRVGWDAKTTSMLRWALPDRFLDWGFVALSGAAKP
ncbi:hypothetical protein HDU82_002434 [Entophlyctis luteolus]|nr:hypothetical protein HDU82_002434 [Entophlyctis luteolus]